MLLSSRGQAKLVDFGLAGADEKIADESITGETLKRATIDYAGLERATGVRKDDARSDIYFIGCIYYHMLSGLPALVETPRSHPAAVEVAVHQRGADSPGLSRASRESWRPW